MTEAASLAEKFKCDKEFKKLCRDFFQMAEKAGQLSARQSANWTMMRNNRVFYADDAMVSVRDDLIVACVRKLGTKLGNEKEVEQLLWKHACGGHFPDHRELTNKFIKSLLERAKSTYTYVCANHLFRFQNNTDRIQIGPVELIAVSNPAQDIFEGKENPDWKLKIGREYAFSASKAVEIQIPSTCWKVSAQASQLNIKEEAEWSIDVAISFLRLSQFERFSAASGFFPVIGGKPEPMPCVIPRVGNPLSVINRKRHIHWWHVGFPHVFH